MIATEEMERLRVRLADLPGFDVDGLWLTAHGQEPKLCIAEGVAELMRVYRCVTYDSAGRLEACWWGEEDATVSTADARTRDALARWVAQRAGLRVGSSAPALLCDEQEWHQWRLVAAPSFLRYTGGLIFDGGAEDGPIALRALRAEDHRLLPDGSRWVDAAALAAVALHVRGAK